MYDFDAMNPRYVIFGNIFLLANRLQTVMDQTVPDLTARQWFLLTMLGMFDQPPTLKQLAEQCDCTHQNIRQLVNKLSEKGFLTIVPDPVDRRSIRIAATPLCEQWNQHNSTQAAAFIDQLFAGLNAAQINAMKTTQITLYEALGTMKERKNDCTNSI